MLLIGEIIVIIIAIIYLFASSLIMFLSKTKKIKGAAENKYDENFNKAKKSIENELIFIQNMMNKETPPLYKYSDIKEKLIYNKNRGILSVNSHLGQRKLLLNEIQFYTRFLPKNEQSIVIYVGSASGEHTPAILNMFPDVKLILIDPAVHYMNVDYEYVYINMDTIPIDSIDVYNDKGGYRLKKYLNQFKNIKFINKEKRYNIVDVINDLQKEETKELLNIKKENEQVGQNVMNKIMKSKHRVFIIQDYATVELLKNIKKSLTCPFVFVSDIRTTMFGPPTDIDIIWNNIQQMEFCRIFNTYSMLKFHPPYKEGNIASMFLKDINKNKITMKYDEILKLNGVNKPVDIICSNYKYIVNDIKTNYTIPKKILIDNTYYYFKGKIFLQPWGPVGTSETRLVLTPDDISAPLVEYNIKEWEDKMFYFRFYRRISYSPLLVNKFSGFDTCYNGCADCSIEIRILTEYLNGDKLNSFEKVEQKLSEEYIQKILNLRKILDVYSGYTLGCRTKCAFHILFNERPYEYYFYQIYSINNINYFYIYKITKTNITCYATFYLNKNYNIFDRNGKYVNSVRFINKKTININSLNILEGRMNN